MGKAATGFQGFPDEAFAFFRDLAAHNERAWFLANKERHERAVKAPMAALVADVGAALAVRGVPLVGDPGTALFRINRDVRFSRDKSPYKTNAGAVLSRDGGKRSQGVLYIQAGAEGGFAAAGFYQLDPAGLGAFRDEIVESAARWAATAASLAKAGLNLRRDDALTLMPRGYESGTAHADDLKLKSFIVLHPLTVAELGHGGLAEQLAEFARGALPLLEFGWAALTRVDGVAAKGVRRG